MVSVKMSPFNRILLTITLFAINVAAALSSDTELACREISTALPKRVSTFLAPSYTSEVNSYWAVNLREAKPACLVLPQSAEEVATIINVLNKYPSVQFAVKSGGHTPNERHSSIRGGVLISMRDISGTTYDAETQLAHVKPGGEWNDVIGELDKFGVAIVGGRLGMFFRPPTEDGI
jgi:FAD/FMN-containing dehydrogenase